MRKNIMWFVLGAILALIGNGILSASRGSEGGWTDQDVSRVVQLLERISDNTAK